MPNQSNFGEFSNLGLLRKHQDRGNHFRPDSHSIFGIPLFEVPFKKDPHFCISNLIFQNPKPGHKVNEGILLNTCAPWTRSRRIQTQGGKNTATLVVILFKSLFRPTSLRLPLARRPLIAKNCFSNKSIPGLALLY